MTKLVMNPFLFFVLALCPLFSAHAEKMDGYGALVYESYSNKSPAEAAISTTGYRLEFGRLSKFASMDLRYTKSTSTDAAVGTYAAYGTTLRFFKHFDLPIGETGSGLSLGAAAGAMYSDAGVPRSDGTKSAFTDVIAYPFARLIFDLGYYVGLGLEADYQVVARRMFVKGTPKSDSDARNRFVLGFSLMLTL